MNQSLKNLTGPKSILRQMSQISIPNSVIMLNKYLLPLAHTNLSYFIGIELFFDDVFCDIAVLFSRTLVFIDKYHFDELLDKLTVFGIHAFRQIQLTVLLRKESEGE
jgi:hypothetical protein